MRLLFQLLIASVFLTGCIHDSKPKDDAGLPDELNKKWENAWNKKDSAIVVGMFDKDISMNTGKTYKGIDSMKSWVSHYMPRIANLKTEKVNVVQGNDMIVYTCTFRHEEIRKEAVAGISTGLCSFVYVKDGPDWKIRYIQMQEFQ
ncbi:MAG TPA: nuclear transport factor 2 family protein [Mucilaginibacter sp.]|nr:nuclear transport factor 2 family protein [Mucilaginibacter sp.]